MSGLRVVLVVEPFVVPPKIVQILRFELEVVDDLIMVSAIDLALM